MKTVILPTDAKARREATRKAHARKWGVRRRNATSWGRARAIARPAPQHKGIES